MSSSEPPASAPSTSDALSSSLPTAPPSNPISLLRYLFRRNIRLLIPAFGLSYYLLSLHHQLPVGHPPYATALASLAFVLPAYLLAELLHPWLNSDLYTPDPGPQTNPINPNDPTSLPRDIILRLLTFWLLHGTLSPTDLLSALFIAYIGNIFAPTGSAPQRLSKTFKRYCVALLAFLVCPFRFDWIPAVVRRLYEQLLVIAWLDWLQIRLEGRLRGWWMRGKMVVAVGWTGWVVVWTVAQGGMLYGRDVVPIMERGG